MALNPPLTSYGEPLRVDGEFFIMKREGVDFEMKVKNGNKYEGKGLMILTTCRIVCINKKESKFKSFDLPLALIYKEHFKQPIFGSNYIGGYCKPLLNSLPGDTEFYIYFTEGGVGTFVPAFMNILFNVRKNNNRGPDKNFMSDFESGVFAKSAYLDPNDPSTIYLEQPANDLKTTNDNKVKNSQDGGLNSNISNIDSNLNNNNINNNVNSNFNNNQQYSNFNDNFINTNVSSNNPNQLNLNNNSSNNSHNVDIQYDYPSINDLQNNNPENAENVNQIANQNNQPGSKYFYFFGPTLNKTNNNNNANNN